MQCTQWMHCLGNAAVSANKVDAGKQIYRQIPVSENNKNTQTASNSLIETRSETEISKGGKCEKKPTRAEMHEHHANCVNACCNRGETASTEYESLGLEP